MKDGDFFPSMVAVANETGSAAYEQVLQTIAANNYFGN